jgi:hypothetical protein
VREESFSIAAGDELRGFGDSGVESHKSRS